MVALRLDLARDGWTIVDPAFTPALANTDLTFSPDRNEVILARPWLSHRPVFVRRHDDSLYVSSDWESLLRLGPAALDLGYVKDYLRFQAPLTERTFADGIRYVRHGERLRVRRDRCVTEPLPRPASPMPATAVVERLGALLPEGDDVCFHLSAGLDSSLLCHLARRLGHVVKAATLRTRGRGASDELDAVERLADEAGVALTVFDLRDFDLWQEGRRLIDCGLAYPVAHPSHLVRYLLDRSIAESGLGRRVVTGRGADETLAGYDAHRDEFAEASRHLARVQCTSEAHIAALFVDGPDGDALANHARLASGGRMSLERRLEYDLGALFEAWNIVDSRLGPALGVEYVQPFLDRELMAMFLALPDGQKLAAGDQKVFLRRELGYLYPDYLLARPKLGLTIDIREYLRGDSVEGILARIHEPSAFATDCLSPGACRRLVEDTLDGRANHGWQIWSLYLCALTYRKLNTKRGLDGQSA
jgi:asparagine synthetase B (glutamine-hydrolysing)